ncbi:Glycosyltransferase involved in cell wall bisynthesis [Lishizhenia tianjinensis]|uniref:Glycosyltransferase involved in cell wall bisynthesis n=1 Tax=Lishizhenia tianjinensis TaxID=477690 RepID=A0A1I7AP78_9FLAO|nr:glycosyltransferase [Lishizhenia tianjinensis]SFT76727.1 Glycosyltransferase involved in cell wall bisynthesis [Lishizhenia tianjinensis]
MKVLFLADINSSHTRKWVRGLISKGVEVEVFSMSFPRVDWYSELDCKCTFFGVNPEVQSKSGLLDKLSYLKAVNVVRKVIKASKADVIHAHYATSYGMLAALFRPTNLVVSVWGSDVQEFPYTSKLHKRILAYVFKRSKIICSTSEAMVNDVKYVVPGIKTKVIPFGIELDEFFVKQHIDKDKITFGTIKTLEKIYGVDVLIDSFNSFIKKTSRDDTLLIIGDGSERKNLEEKVSHLGLNDRVTFLGRINQTDVPKKVHNLDVYVSLSRRESFGVAVLEASASGIPVISSEASGFKEVVEQDVTGFRVALENVDQIVDRMVLLTDYRLRTSMGLAGRNLVEERYDFERNLEDQILIYKNLIQKK